jgi:hypothetical protein
MPFELVVEIGRFPSRQIGVHCFSDPFEGGGRGKAIVILMHGMARIIHFF